MPDNMGTQPTRNMEFERLRALRAKRGYILPFHEMLARHLPDVLDAYDSFYSSIWFTENHLTARERELVAVGVHAAALEREGLRIHIERGLRAGATEAEIVEAIALAAIPTGMYSVLVASEVWQEIFPTERETNPGM
jgi:alkylhydroperoxidase/carboxymuconolactone decarboxylase family protein YurZ